MIFYFQDCWLKNNVCKTLYCLASNRYSVNKSHECSSRPRENVECAVSREGKIITYDWRPVFTEGVTFEVGLTG